MSTVVHTAMKRLFFTLLLAAMAVHANSQERVLFIGNSLTYFNDMPQLFAVIANEKGYRVEVDSYTVGGTGLAEMLASGEVVRLIESERWDKMVLQPGTGESAGMSISVDSTAWVVRQLVERLHAVNPDAKVCLYEISNGITAGAGNGDYDYYLYIQQRILDTVAKIARLTEVPIAPAGECFREHYAGHHDLMLHSSFNDIHPNAAGSYLVACAIFETLFEEFVVPCGYYGELGEAQALYLQQVADAVVLPNRERWLMGNGTDNPDNPTAVQTACHESTCIYPNPTSGLLHVGVDSEVAIFDPKGNKTLMQPQSDVLDLSAFAPGIYVIQTGSFRQKLVIRRP